MNADVGYEPTNGHLIGRPAGEVDGAGGCGQLMHVVSSNDGRYEPGSTVLVQWRRTPVRVKDEGDGPGLYAFHGDNVMAIKK